MHFATVIVVAVGLLTSSCAQGAEDTPNHDTAGESVADSARPAASLEIQPAVADTVTYVNLDAFSVRVGDVDIAANGATAPTVGWPHYLIVDRRTVGADPIEFELEAPPLSSGSHYALLLKGYSLFVVEYERWIEASATSMPNWSDLAIMRGRPLH